jgi:choline monooxygenase
MTARHRELDRFDAECPIERAATPPSAWYTDPSFHELERAWLRTRWQPLARSDQLAVPGDFVADCWLGEPVVTVRAADGRLCALRNACLHHGAEVARNSGNARRLVCPYHGWSYELDGTLAAMPRADGIEGIAPGGVGLARLPVAECGPFVFASLCDATPAGPPLPPALEALLDEARWRELSHIGRRTYSLRCNWKVYVDNYLDGGYHVAPLHRGLGSQLDGATYRTEVRDRWIAQTVRAAAPDAVRDGGDGGDFAERLGAGALYAFVHPNFMLNRYGPFLDTNWVVPVAVDRTWVVFDDFVDGAAPEVSGPGGEEFVERALAASDAVQREDEAICESVQRSLESSAFDRGRYAPAVETGLHAFHRWLAADLAAGAAGAPDRSEG